MHENNHDTLALIFRKAQQQLESGDYVDAEINFQNILNAIPNHVDTLNYLGVIKKFQGNNDAALEYFKKASENTVSDAEVFFNLGCTYQALGQWQNAKQALLKALSINPDYAMAHNNLSTVLVSLGSYEEMARHIIKAYELSPGSLEILVNYATYLSGRNAQYTEAINLFRKALEINPQFDKAIAGLCHAYYKIGMHEEGNKYLRKFRFTKESLSPYNSSFLFLHNYEPTATPDEIFQAHKEWGNALTSSLENKISHSTIPRKNHDKLRIGYVSPNFNTHPVAYFIENILSNHDQSKFTIIAYAQLKDEDFISQQFKKYFSLWRNTFEMNDDEMYQQIIKDEIDILVDLAGHSSRHRLKVFARKPAPIQITYLGYPNTTGLPTMDYRITDPWCDPPGMTDQWHTETLIRLQSGFLCYRPPDNSPPVEQSPFVKNGYITFGCINNPLKINNRVITLWSKILNQVPDSKLLLKDRIYADDVVRQTTLERLQNHGIPPNRVELLNSVKGHYDALNVYAKIDIALDPFPYNGTTTTSEALWMGVPLITLIGDTHVSRVSYSILNQIGCGKLAANSPEEYVQIAVALASNPSQMNQYRNQLRDLCKQSTFTNGQYFTQLLESVYQEVWGIYSRQSADNL